MNGCFLNPLMLPSIPILSPLFTGRLKKAKFNYFKCAISLQAPIVFSDEALYHASYVIKLPLCI